MKQSRKTHKCYAAPDPGFPMCRLEREAIFHSLGPQVFTLKQVRDIGRRPLRR
jgi:hypothetical protein